MRHVHDRCEYYEHQCGHKYQWQMENTNEIMSAFHLKPTNIPIILRIKYTFLIMACNVLYGLLHCNFSDLSSFHSLPCSLCCGLDFIEPAKLISTLQRCQLLLFIPGKLCFQLFMHLIPLLNSSFCVKSLHRGHPLATFFDYPLCSTQSPSCHCYLKLLCSPIVQL